MATSSRSQEAPLFLGIGEIIVSPRPLLVTTTLGSCVSVCLYATDRSAGGISHFALPQRLHAGADDDEFRYGDKSTCRLVDEVAKITRSRHKLRAKLIGGGHMGSDLESAKIGLANVQMARKILLELGVEIVAEATGGRGGWKVFFDTGDGRLRYCRLALSPSEMAASLEGSIAAPRPKPAPRRKRVLIVDDSATVRKLLSASFARDPELEVVGAVDGPSEAHPLLDSLRPDVMTLDVHMPDMDGVTYLERLRPQDKVRVVMVTALSPEDGGKVFRALELGAIDYIQKPALSDLASISATICEKIKVIASSQKMRPATRASLPQRRPSSPHRPSRTVIAVGASTGGTEAIKQVLTELPAQIPPILIVQHIPPVFSFAFAKRLSELCAFDVKEAEDGDEVRSGRALVAPGGRHMRLLRKGRGLVVALDDKAPVNRHRPSVDVLFESVAETMGSDAIGIMLTGMGNDGAKGMLAMRRQRAFTMAQDEETSVVYGMPKAAVQCGAVCESLALHAVAERLLAVLLAAAS